jgi:hypothetical protein
MRFATVDISRLIARVSRTRGGPFEEGRKSTEEKELFPSSIKISLGWLPSFALTVLIAHLAVEGPSSGERGEFPFINIDVALH